jgi:HK97 family phage portal protein
MSKKRSKRSNESIQSSIGFLISDGDSICVSGYTPLDQNPEIMTACRKVAELIGSITIHLMANTAQGDVRIVNELSKAIDIDPMPNMTRKVWMEAIVMNLLLYGNGNSIVLPHTFDGYLQSLEPIAASRVSLMPKAGSYRDYQILIDGRARDPASVLHFVHNPDKYYLWKGRGLSVSLRDIATNLKQAAATEKGFMESKWKPSLIVKVDAMTEEFSGKEGRRKLREDYIETGEAGAPWIIPAEQFQVQEVRPLSLADLAISDVVQLDKRAVASIIGVPPFVLGVGDYNATAWNSFVQNTVRPICLGIAQELTKKLIISPKWYFRFNVLSLMDWDLRTVADVFGALSDRGFVTGNEVRDRIGMSPADGLDEFRILENYIPYDMSGQQKKLIKEGENG